MWHGAGACSRKSCFLEMLYKAWILQHIGGHVPQNLQLCLIQAVQTQGAALKELWSAGTVQGVMQPVDRDTN